MERDTRKDPFNDGIAKRVTRDTIRYDYSLMDARERRERREAENSSWIKTGDKNIIKSDSLPKVPPQKPSR